MDNNFLEWSISDSFSDKLTTRGGHGRCFRSCWNQSHLQVFSNL